MTIQEIKAALRQMSVSERDEIRAWLLALDDDEWGRQMEADAETGRLDAWLAEVEEECRAREAKPL